MPLATIWRRFASYDAGGLVRLVKATEFIEVHRPEVSKDLLQAFEQFRSDSGFRVAEIRNALNDATGAHVRDVVATLRSMFRELREVKAFGRWLVHNHPVLAQPKAHVAALAARSSREAQVHSRHFRSTYARLGRSPMHQDPPWATWTPDLCPAPEFVETNHA
jgi:hypothetical protein